MNAETIFPDGALCEIEKMRTPYAKHFLMRDKTVKAVACATPLHFNRDGVLENCNTEFRSDLTIHDALFDLEILPLEVVGFRYQSKRGGAVTCILTRLNGERVRAVKRHESKTEGNVHVWHGVAPGLDIQLVVEPNRAELFKVLHDERAPTEFEWAYIFHGDRRNIKCARKTEGWDNEVLTSKGKIKSRRDIQIENHFREGRRVSFLHERYTGKAVVRDSQRRKRLVDSVAWPVVIDATISENITAGGDDVQENGPAYTLSTAGSKIRLGFGPFTMTPTSTYMRYDGGFRFQTINMPAGSTISNCKLKLYRAADSGTPNVSFKVFIDDVADAAGWTAGNLPRGITKWPAGGKDLDLNTTLGSPGNTFTASMTTAMQRIVDKTGWQPNNDVRFLVEIYSGTQSQWVEVWAFEKSSNIPLLEITYTPPGNEVDLLWNELANVGDDLDVVFNIAAAVGQELDLLWNVYINIDAPKDLAMSWHVLANAGNELDILWDAKQTGELSQGVKYIVRPDIRQDLRGRGDKIDLRGQQVRVKLGHLTARVDALEIVSLEEAKARSGKLYAVGEERRQGVDVIPAKGDEDALLFILSLVDGDAE